MSKNSFDRLNNNQKQVLLEAGKKAEEYLYKESVFLDQELEKIFKQ